MLTALIIFAACAMLVLLLGLQQMNVHGGHRLLAAVTSLMIGTANIAILKVMPGPTGWPEIAAYLAGGPVGILASMWLHPWLAMRFGRKA